MKRFLLWFFGGIFGLLLLICIAIFSPIGNAIFKPIIQSQISAHSPIPLQLKKFYLAPSSLKIVLLSDTRLELILKGDYNLFTSRVDLTLDVLAKDIALFGDVVGIPLSGSFETHAKVQGKVLDMLHIQVASNIAQSQTTLDITLQNLAPAKIFADIKDLHLNEMLAMLGQKPYVNGLFALDADILSKGNDEFDGKALLTITQGTLAHQLIQNDFGVTIPQTAFAFNFNALFNRDTIAHDLTLKANIGKILSQGNTQISTHTTDSTYLIDFSDISVFAPLAGTKMRGSIQTNGKILGTAKQLTLNGASNVAESTTTYEVVLKDFAPDAITFDIKNLKLEKLLSMLYLPPYITGLQHSSGKLWDLDKGISANVAATTQGTILNTAIKQGFGFDMPNTPFTYKANISLDKGIGAGDVQLDSKLINLRLNPLELNINNSTISFPYTAKIPDLKRLKFITNIELSGALEANGDVKIDEQQKLQATLRTKSLGGEIYTMLKDDEVQTQIKELDLISLLKMAQYPQVFSAKVNGNMTYNLTSQHGKLNAILSSARFTNNHFTNMVQQHLNFNMTGLLFNDIKLQSTLKKFSTTSDLAMQSGDFTMRGDNIMLDLEKNTIDANLKTSIKGDSINLQLKGAISSPQVVIDFGDLLKKRANQTLQKELQKIDKGKAIDALKGLLR